MAKKKAVKKQVESRRSLKTFPDWTFALQKLVETRITNIATKNVELEAHLIILKKRIEPLEQLESNWLKQQDEDTQGVLLPDAELVMLKAEIVVRATIMRT